MNDDAKQYLLAQFDVAWQLTTYHLDGLTTEECLWRPTSDGLHVHPGPDGWRADWPDREGYDIGPASIGWVTWHINFWWSMALDHSFGKGTLAREEVRWAGTAEGARARIVALHGQWRTALEGLSADDLRSSARTKWPFPDRPFGELIGWLNIELMKNAAEIGSGRFLYAVRGRLSKP